MHDAMRGRAGQLFDALPGGTNDVRRRVPAAERRRLRGVHDALPDGLLELRT